MTGWIWERLAGLAGIVAVVLWIVSVFVQESSNLPDEDNPAEVLAWFQNESGTILGSSFFFILGSVFFLVFVGALRARLLAAEGPGAFWTAIAFAGGLAVGILTMLIPGPSLAGALSENELTEDAALALVIVDDAFFAAAELSAALLLAATGLVILRYGALPRWLAWISFLFALWLLIPPIGWAGLLLGVPLWTIVIGVLMWMRPAGQPVAAPPPTTPT
jgi:hypothetical protein